MDDKYETNDIHLAAYFKVAGCDMVSRYKQGPRWIFVFENPAGDINKLREEYFSGRAKVSAIRFAQEIQNMKQLCFE